MGNIIKAAIIISVLIKFNMGAELNHSLIKFAALHSIQSTPSPIARSAQTESGAIAGEEEGKKMNNAPQKIYGDLFRIPNGFFVTNLAKSAEMVKELSAYELGPLPEKNTWIRVWVTDPGAPDKLFVDLTEEQRDERRVSCNWHRHGHRKLRNFPDYLPLALFLDREGRLKKEGDMVTFTYKDPEDREKIEVVLKLNQLGYRYSSCGADEGGGFDKCVRASKEYASCVKPYIKE